MKIKESSFKWQSKKVLVSGAGGFIGSHLVERLAGLGADVKVLVRYNSRGNLGLMEMLPEETLKQIRVIMGDIRDAEAVRNAARGTDVVFHLASIISIPYSYVNPRDAVETNFIGALNMLTAARDVNVEKFVHTSTSEAYGTALYVPIDENHPLQGQSPYSASKIGADKLAESFYRSFGLPVATIRPFNSYGPRQSARAVIPAIITQAVNSGKVQLGSLHPTRDFTFVDDLVRAFIMMAESPGTVGEVINVGSNFEISVGDLAKRILSLLPERATIQLDPARVRPERSEVERLWCDNHKARELLGWSPETDMDQGLLKTIGWLRENSFLYKPQLYNI